MRTSTFAPLPGDFPPGPINSAGSASPTASGCGTEKAPWTSGRSPAGLCPPNAETQARASRPVVGASRDPESLARQSHSGGTSAARTLRVSRVRGALGGPGPRAPRARCVPRSARKSRRAGAARLRAAFSPPPPAPRGFGRQGAGAGGAGVLGPSAWGNGADRCPGALTGRRASCTGDRPDACWCWQPDRQCQVEEVTGLRGAPDGVALWTVSTPRGEARH